MAGPHAGGYAIALLDSWRLGDPRIQALLSAIVFFAFVPRGVTHRQLRDRLAAPLGLDPGARLSGRVTFDQLSSGRRASR